jgi:DNA repair photolyase
MIKEIHTRTILNHVRQPEPYFGLKYNMNLYRGCQHQCIYCDSRSECYRIANFAEIHVKINAIELLADALPRKRVRGTIGFGSMNDTYMPVERKYKMTRQALELVAQHRFSIHIITKSDLVLRDLDLLREISKVYAAISFTITTIDDDLSRVLEPGAPPSSARFAAMKTLAQAGILTGLTMMPVLPFIEDTVENITGLVEKAHESGASYVLPWFGMSLRAGSRDYYYKKLDECFPGIKAKYERQFGDRYECNSPHQQKLNNTLQKLVDQYGILTRMPVFTPQKISNGKGAGKQLDLF